MHRSIYLAGGAVLIAIAAWAGTALFAQAITDQRAARIADISTVQAASAKEEAALRFKALVSDTRVSRATLESDTRLDVVSLANLIEETGKAAGAKIQVSNAQPDTSSGSKETTGINFAIEAQGSFASIIQTVRLFETLPVPSQIQEVDIERIPQAGNAGADLPWHLSLRLLVITTAQISP